jgi:type 1 glutamine amidotransferase
VSTQKITTAVVTGRHPFDVRAFHALFRSIPEIDVYIQHMEEFVSDPGSGHAPYDVAVFYHMFTPTPTGEGPWYEKRMKPALEALGETGQGILVLHHALLAFPEWPLWSEIVGIEDRRFGYHMGQSLRIEIANPDHPITRGLSAWEMGDETYTMHDTGAGSDILLTTDHQPSMRTIGWTRRFRNSPVFCLQSGHDAAAFGDPNLREVMGRGIRWLAGK